MPRKHIFTQTNMLSAAANEFGLGRVTGPVMQIFTVLAYQNHCWNAIQFFLQKLLQDDYGEEDDLDGDALGKLFSQLEEDLKNDGLSTNDNDDDISEEDMVRLEQELEEAFGYGSEDEISGTVHSNMDNVESYDDDSDDEVERPLKLRTWQLRRLASALKIGRRKTSVSYHFLLLLMVAWIWLLLIVSLICLGPYWAMA